MSEPQYTPGAIAVGCVTLLLLPAWVAWKGFCLWILWNWFAPEPFAHLSYGAACGLDALVSFFKLRHPGHPSGGDERIATSVATEVFWAQVGLPGLVLLIGWGVHALAGRR